MLNNDPNIYWGKKTVKLVYQMWQYKHEAYVTIGGNCRGKTILESAHDQYIEDLYDKNSGYYMILFDDEGAKLEVNAFASKDDDPDEEWAQDDFEKDMADALVSVEIVEIIPEK